MGVTKGTLSLAGESGLSPNAFAETLLRKAVEKVNSGVSLTLTARRSSERPPRDSRHLTDTRTRVSTLLEYSLAYEMNHVLDEDGQGYSVSSVLWNIFPDLIVRDPGRNNLLGLEVKALHTAAEEKSANFMTPLPIIRRQRDFVVIVSWGWQTTRIRETEITYPHIHAAGLFDAWLLAKIRDYGWLLKQGGRIKGIDLSTPIINANKRRYKAEERNLGKLMRIHLPSDMPTSVPHYKEMSEEHARYAEFKQLVLGLGLRETFLDLCMLERAVDVSADRPERYPVDTRVLGTATRPGGKPILLIAGSRPQKLLNGTELAGQADGSACLWLSVKLDWRIYAKRKGIWKIVAEGTKPDSRFDAIQKALETI